jgi:hypothetical protein
MDLLHRQNEMLTERNRTLSLFLKLIVLKGTTQHILFFREMFIVSWLVNEFIAFMMPKFYKKGSWKFANGPILNQTRMSYSLYFNFILFRYLTLYFLDLL